MAESEEMIGVVDRAERRVLLELLYEKRKDRYPDLRKLDTKKKLMTRKKQLDSRIEKAVAGSEYEKRLKLERNFVILKISLCYGENLPMVMVLDRAMLQIHDGASDLEETLEEKAQSKKDCSLVLLRWSLIKNSDQELKEMILSQV